MLRGADARRHAYPGSPMLEVARPFACLTALLGSIISGCGRSENLSVAIAPRSAEVTVGGKVAFTGIISGSANAGVLWSVAEPEECGTVSQAGLYSAPQEAAICHVVVASSADPSKTATATVTVAAPCSPFMISPNSVVVPPGGTHQFTSSPLPP